MSLLLLAAGSETPAGLPAVNAELQTLSPSAEIELFEIDATVLGDTIYRFHSGKNGLTSDIVWQGNTYSAFPIEVTGFELTGKGVLPRPKARVSNVLGTMSALILMYDDLVGCKFTRIRTLAKFLDGDNFQRRNILTYTEAFSKFWNKGNLTITPFATPSPVSNRYADKLVVNANNSGHVLEYYKAGLLTGGTTYTMSGYFKAGELSRFRFWMGSLGYGAKFNLSTGVVISLGGTQGATITDVGNGWYYCTNTYTVPSDFAAVRIIPLDATLADSWQGDGVSGLYAWGIQVEVGATATDYQSVGSSFVGNPTADPTAEYPRDIYYIDRRAAETREFVEFELASSLDLAGVRLPRRQIVQNYCPWKYRGAECGYTGTNYFDTNDASVGSLALDVCGKRLSSCRARFGSNAELPYGGFPAAGLVKA